MLRSKISVISLSLAISIVPVSASASSFSSIIAIGDSLTDSGNVAIYLNPFYQPVPFGGLIPSAAYQSGRFTNGPTWVETLANRLGLSITPFLAGGTNFAVGGARTGPFGTIPPTPTSLLDQFAIFQNGTGGIAPSDALYVVWGGTNNARDAAIQKSAGDNTAATATLTQAATDIATIIGGLKNAGAVNIIVPNIGELEDTPEATRRTTGLDTDPTTVSVQYNTLLKGALTPFRNDKSLNLLEIDAFNYYASINANPGNFGLTDVTNPCVELASVCSNPDQFFFYDGLHPSETVHRQFGEFVFAQVSVPEPLTMLGAGAALGFGGLFKGKLAKAKSEKKTNKG